MTLQAGPAFASATVKREMVQRRADYRVPQQQLKNDPENEN